VTFRLGAEDVGFHDDAGRLVVEPGTVEVYLGTSSAATLRETFVLT
jgi:beta-glucosidase